MVQKRIAFLNHSAEPPREQPWVLRELSADSPGDPLASATAQVTRLGPYPTPNDSVTGAAVYSPSMTLA